MIVEFLSKLELIVESCTAAENDHRIDDRLKWLNKRSALGVFVG